MSDPSTVHGPPDQDGIRWRPVTPEDAEGLAQHTLRIHRNEPLAEVYGADFFRWLIAQPGLDPEHDYMVAEQDERIVADCGTWLRSAENAARCIVWAEVSPGFESLRPGMLAWVEARARTRMAGLGDVPKALRVPIEDNRSGYRTDVEAAGFHTARAFIQMSRPLAGLPARLPIPDGIDIVPWSTHIGESARVASNEAFTDHWGSLPLSQQEFAALVTDNPAFRPDLSFVATADGEVVSLCACGVVEDAAGSTEFWVDQVATVSRYRRLGLASHLIMRSLETAAAIGDLDRARLSVDEASGTNATAVYESLGFRTDHRKVVYVKEL